MITRAERLDGVHIDLIRVVIRAGVKTDFMVLQGMRTIEEQRKLLAAGKSQTLNSRHLTGHAVDLAVLVNNQITWEFAEYKRMADCVLAAAFDLRILLTWGGNWKSLKDGPHFELPTAQYPTTIAV